MTVYIKRVAGLRSVFDPKSTGFKRYSVHVKRNLATGMTAWQTLHSYHVLCEEGLGWAQ